MRLQIGKEQPQTPDALPAVASGLVLMEVFVATLFVVGLFDAACQPWGWPCVLQFGTCAALGALLWLADSKLQRMAAATVAAAAVAEGAVDACRGEFRRDSLS